MGFLASLLAGSLLSSHMVIAQGDVANPVITVHMQNVPFSLVLRTLGQVSGSNFVLPDDLASQIDPNQKCSLDAVGKPLQDCLTDLLGQLNPPLTFHIENGKYVLDAKGPKQGTNPPKATGVTLDFDGVPFDTAIERLFQQGKDGENGYRISPDVTQFLEPVSLHVHNTTLQEALKQLLESVSTSKSPLTFRMTKAYYMYVITNRDSSKESDKELKREAIGLPSYHPLPAIQKVKASKERLIVPLIEMFEQAKASYLLKLPTGVAAMPRVDFDMQNVPLEQAVVHLLRSADALPSPPLPRFRFNAFPDWQETSPSAFVNGDGNGDKTKNGTLSRLYMVQPDTKYLRGPRPFELQEGYRVSYHLRNVNLYDALKSLLTGASGNYTFDPGLRAISVTCTGRDVLLEKAIDQVVASSAVPLVVKNEGGVLSIKRK